MLLYISLLTIILSGLLVTYNWRINKNTIYLGAFFSILATYGLTHYFTIYANSPFWLAVFYNNFSPFWFLTGPLLLFYYRGTLTDNSRLKGTDIIHFIPFLVQLIGIFPYLLTPFSYKIDIAAQILNDLNLITQFKVNWITKPIVNFLGRPILVFLYLGYITYLLWLNNPKSNRAKVPIQQFKLTYRWLILLEVTTAILIINFFLLSLSLSKQTVTATMVNAQFTHFFSGIAYFCMSFMLLLFPRILYGMPIYTANTITEISSQEKLKKETNPIVEPINIVAEIQLPQDDPFFELVDKINAYLKKEEPYLNPEFTINELAAFLKVPVHHVSYCLNTLMNVKFTSLRTQLRIQYAAKLLDSGQADELSMDGIGKKSGFSTRSNFYNAFKTETGMTPSEYLERKNELN
jgi:AraC-like DNA-binding protein